MKNKKSAFRAMVSCCLLLSSLAACDRILSENETNKIELVRVFAPIRSYDCEGRLISEQNQEVNAPSKWVRIYSKKDNPRILTADVTNRRLPTSNTAMISYSSDSYISFMVHYSDTLIGLQVKDGMNTIDYKINHDSYTGTDSESGQMDLDISYREVYESRIRHYHPSPTSCESQVDL